MKTKQITKKEVIRRGLTPKAWDEVQRLLEAVIEDPTSNRNVKGLFSPMGNPVQDTSEPLAGLQ